VAPNTYQLVQQALEQAKLGRRNDLPWRKPAPFKTPLPWEGQQVAAPKPTLGGARAIPDAPKRGGGLTAALSWLQGGKSAVASTLKETIDFVQGENFSGTDWWDQTKSHYGFGDLLREERTAVGLGLMALAPITGGITAGLLSGTALAGKLSAFDSMTEHSDRILGFLGDVAIDPLTYMGGYNVMARNLGGYKKVGAELSGLKEIIKNDPSEMVRLANEAGFKNVGKGAAKRMDKAIDKAIELGQQGRSMSSMARVLSKTDEGKIVARVLGLDPGLRIRMPGTGPITRGLRKYGSLGVTKTGAYKKALQMFPEDTGLHRLLSQQRVRNVPVKYKRGYTDEEYGRFIKDMRKGRAQDVPEDVRRYVGVATRAPKEIRVALPKSATAAAASVFKQADIIPRLLRNIPVTGTFKPWQAASRLASAGEDIRQVFTPEYWKNLDPKVRDDLQGGLTRMFRNHFNTSDEVFRELLYSGDPELISAAWLAEDAIRYALGKKAFVQGGEVMKSGRSNLAVRARLAKVRPQELYDLIEAVARKEILLMEDGVVVGINRNSDWFKTLPSNVQALEDDVLVGFATDFLRMMDGAEKTFLDEIPNFQSLLNDFDATGERGFVPRRMTESQRKRWGFQEKFNDFEVVDMITTQSMNKRAWTPGNPIRLEGQALVDARKAGRAVQDKRGNWVISAARGSDKPFIIKSPRDINKSVRRQINDLSMQVFNEPMYEDDVFKVLSNYSAGMGVEVANEAFMSQLKRLGVPVESINNRGISALKNAGKESIELTEKRIAKEALKGAKKMTRVQKLAMAQRAAFKGDLDQLGKWLKDYRRRLTEPEKFRDDMPLTADDPSIPKKGEGDYDSYVPAAGLEAFVPSPNAPTQVGGLFWNSEMTGAVDELFIRLQQEEPELFEALSRMLYLYGDDNPTPQMVRDMYLNMLADPAQQGDTLKGLYGFIDQGDEPITGEFADALIRAMPELFYKADASQIGGGSDRPLQGLFFKIKPEWAKKVLINRVDQSLEEFDQYSRLLETEVAIAGEVDSIVDELGVIGRELEKINTNLPPNPKVPSRVDELLERQFELATRYEELHRDYLGIIRPQVDTLQDRIATVGETLVTRQIPKSRPYKFIGGGPDAVTVKGLNENENKAVNAVLARIFSKEGRSYGGGFGDTVLIRNILGLTNDNINAYFENLDQGHSVKGIFDPDPEDPYWRSFFGEVGYEEMGGRTVGILEDNFVQTWAPFLKYSQEYDEVDGILEISDAAMIKIINAVRKEAKRISQESLADYPDTLTVYRYGGDEVAPSFTLNPALDVEKAWLHQTASHQHRGFDAFKVKKKDIMFVMDARDGSKNIPGVPEAEVLINPAVASRKARTPITMFRDLGLSNSNVQAVIQRSMKEATDRIGLVNESVKNLKLQDRSINQLRKIEEVINRTGAEPQVAKQTPFGEAVVKESATDAKYFKTWEEYMDTVKSNDPFVNHENYISVGITGEINMVEARGLLDDVLNRMGRLEQSVTLREAIDPITRGGPKASLKYRQFDMTDEEVVAATSDAVNRAEVMFTEAQTLRDQATALKAQRDSLYGAKGGRVEPRRLEREGGLLEPGSLRTFTDDPAGVVKATDAILPERLGKELSAMGSNVGDAGIGQRYFDQMQGVVAGRYGVPDQIENDIRVLEQFALMAEIEGQSLAREAADILDLTTVQRGVAGLRDSGMDLDDLNLRGLPRQLQFDPLVSPQAMDAESIDTWVASTIDGMANWGPWRVATGNIALDEGMVAAAKAFQFMNSPQEISNFWRKYDTLLNLLKAQMIATPGFIARNIFGAFFNAVIDGVNPAEIIRTFKLTRDIGERADDEGVAFLDMARRMASESGDQRLKNYVELLERGVRGGGQATVSVTVPVTGRGLKNHARGQIILGMGSERAAAKANELIATSYVPWASNFVYYQAIRSMNMQAEDVIRLGVGLDTMRWGGSAEDALQRIATSQFDYGELTTFEKKFMSRAMPFYTWTRKNVPYQLQQLGRHPNRYVALMHAKKNLEYGTDDKGVVPDYFLEPFGIRTPFSYAGARLYSVPDLPFQDLLRYDPFAYTQGELGDSMAGVKGALQNLAWQISPIFKTPVELGFQKQLSGFGAPFTGQHVEIPWLLRELPGLMPALNNLGLSSKEDGEWKMADHTLYMVLSAMPALATLRRVLPSEPKYQEKYFETMFSAGLGISFKRLTPERQESYTRHLRYLQNKLDDERGFNNVQHLMSGPSLGGQPSRGPTLG
jgi:hypothetical protein